MNVQASLSTIVTNTISTNVTSTLSINFDDKKVRYKMNCYILHTFFFSDHITFHNRYYLLSLYKIKTYWRTNNIKWKIINLKESVLKI